MKREIRLTEDGSTTLFVPDLNENYHSVHGAIQESMHVFIYSGLNMLKEHTEINIFEMGFGTGLNCLLTLIHRAGRKINYFALEKYPLEEAVVNQLNFTKVLNADVSFAELFHAIHSLSWNNSHNAICPDFYLSKCEDDILHVRLERTYDLVYFDAFAPQFQPELWTPQVFEKMYSVLNKDGILVTYCAKGEVRRNMKACGFWVERIPGPPGKREMLRAWKK